MPKVNTGPKLKLNGSGVWEIHWTENGRSKRASTRTKDRAQALQVLSGFLSGKDEQTGGPVLFSSVWSDYLAEHVEPNVIDKRRIEDAGEMLLSRFGDRDVRDIQPADLLRYRTERTTGRLHNYRKQKVSAATVRLELVYMRAAINHAIEHRRLNSTEAPRIDLPERSLPRDKWLTEIQEADLLSKVAQLTEKDGKVHRVHLFVAIALDTASRKRAIETLKWSRVDFEARLIDFRDTERVRSRKRRVPVPISDRLMPLLRRARDENPDAEFVLGGDGLLDTVFRWWMKKFGYPWVTPHVLRHTWGTLAARAGIDLFKIAGVMGDTLTTVEKNYLHHCPDHLREAVERRKKAGTEVERVVAMLAALTPDERALVVAELTGGRKGAA